MSLDLYTSKRNFDTTPEPEASITHLNANRFVVQRHKASHLHYDVRLEMDGVLKSWAVPKGPSMNAKDKRLAIHTEDHPVAYLTFEGTIPKGNYGAGVMQIWDSGTYSIIPKKKGDTAVSQYKEGDIKLNFQGAKLKGLFALVRTNRGEGHNQWLLIKKSDVFSTQLSYDAEVYAQSGKEDKRKVPSIVNPSIPIQPMLASDAKKIFNDPNYIFELKWDGYRMLSNIENNIAQLYSRNGIPYTDKFANIATELSTIAHDCILDGEVVVVDENGVSNFQLLQDYDAGKGSLMYYVFDLLYLNGHATISLPVVERKSLLPELLDGLTSVRYCDHMEGMGTALYQKAIEAGMEGVIAKEKTSVYTPNYRSPQWLKIKETKSDEVIICGYTDSKSALFGSLILGRFIAGELHYSGNCGSGFSQKKQGEILDRLAPLRQDTSPFNTKINLKGRKPNWVVPQISCEVTYSEMTKGGKFRHPVFKRLLLNTQDAVVDTSNDLPRKKLRPEKHSSSSTLSVGEVAVPITNLEKIYFPGHGYTKYDLIDYYLNIADIIVPYLVDRPQNLHRHPNGIHHSSFYQKDHESLPSWLQTYAVYSTSSHKEIEYLLCQNEASLLYMANLGCIELNPWHSTIKNLNAPTYTVIDLDPSVENTFEQVIEVALAAKELLDFIKIAGFVKTSGSRGLHIYIPLAGTYTYEEARDFTKLLCYYIQEKLPALTSMERAVKNRKGKIYLDYLQNRKGQTIAAPFCVRPKEGAPVSMPLPWTEIKPGLQIGEYTIKTVQKHLKILGDSFRPVLEEGIHMKKALDIVATL